MQTILPSNLTNGIEPQHFFEQLQQELERLLDRFRGYPRVSAADAHQIGENP